MSNVGDPVTSQPSDKEIEKYIQSLVKGLKPLVANLTGENVEISLSDNMLQKMKNGVKLALDFDQKQNAIKNENIPDEEKQKKYFRNIESLLKTFFGESDNPVLEIAQIIDPNHIYEKNIPNENFRTKIRNTVHETLRDIDKIGKIQQISDFLNSARNEDVFAMSQSAFRLEKKLPFMMKTRKRIARKTIEKFIEFHKEISGFMEHLLAILYGLREIKQNRYKPFTEIKERIAAGNLLNQLKLDSTFNILIERYDSNIRNAVAHVSYRVDPIGKKIEFSDKGKTFSLTYSQFVKYLQELTELVIILCHIEQEFNYLKILGYAQVRKNMFDSDRP